MKSNGDDDVYSCAKPPCKWDLKKLALDVNFKTEINMSKSCSCTKIREKIMSKYPDVKQIFIEAKI
jgi:hypothetical protein